MSLKTDTMHSARKGNERRRWRPSAALAIIYSKIINQELMPRYLRKNDVSRIGFELRELFSTLKQTSLVFG